MTKITLDRFRETVKKAKQANIKIEVKWIYKEGLFCILNDNFKMLIVNNDESRIDRYRAVDLFGSFPFM